MKPDRHNIVLGDLVEFMGGGTPSRDDQSNWQGDIPWASIKDLSGNAISRTEEFISEKGLKNSASNLIPAGTVIMATRVGLGKVAINSIPVAINQDLKALNPKNGNLLPRYLLFYLTSIAEEIERAGTGATVKGITLGYLKKIRVPVPSLPDQERIVMILDASEELKHLREQADRRTDDLIPALFHEMFGDPATNPKRWPERLVLDLCDVKGGKRLPKGEEYSPVPTAYRYIRVKDFTDGTIDESNLVCLKPETQEKIRRYTVDAGDIAITIAGTIGQIAPIPSTLSGANLTENAAKLVAKDKGAYDPTFFSEILRTPYAQKQIGSHTGQVTIGKLALFRIEKLKIILPPLPLQRSFAARVAAIRAMEANQAASRHRINDLFQSLLHRAFRGNL